MWPHGGCPGQAGTEQNAPILRLLAGHSTETGCLPVQPLSWGSLSLQPRKWPGCEAVLDHSWRPWPTEQSVPWAFPRSIWPCMTGSPSSCVDSETATQCCAGGDSTGAGDLGYCDLCGVSGCAPVWSGRSRTHWESLGCCPLELAWKVAGSKSHSASRAPLDHRLWPLRLVLGQCPQRVLCHCQLTGIAWAPFRDAGIGLHATSMGPESLGVGIFSSSPGDPVHTPA